MLSLVDYLLYDCVKCLSVLQNKISANIHKLCKWSKVRGVNVWLDRDLDNQFCFQLNAFTIKNDS